MTAILSIIDLKNKKTYLASDEMGSNGFSKENFKTKKIFKIKHLSFAYCGSYRIGQVVQYKLNPRPFQIGETVDDYVFNYLEEELINVLSKNGCISIKNDIKSLDNAELIIAIKDRCFLLQEDLALLESNKIYLTSGSGKYHTEASIHTQLEMNKQKKYEDILKDAIKYTSKVVTSVGGEPQIIIHNH